MCIKYTLDFKHLVPMKKVKHLISNFYNDNMLIYKYFGYSIRLNKIYDLNEFDLFLLLFKKLGCLENFTYVGHVTFLLDSITLDQWVSKCGHLTISNSITWELVRNANHGAPPPTY